VGTHGATTWERNRPPVRPGVPRCDNNDRRVSSRLRIPSSLVAATSLFGLAACGLSLAGLGASPGGSPPDASPSDVGAPGADGASTGGEVDGESPLGAPDSAARDSSPPIDATSDGGGPEAAPVCTPFDSGVSGALVLSAFVVVGTASENENSDGRLTLTNSDNNQAGAAWYPTKLDGVAGYALTWTLRVGPGDTAGDGITFAVLTSSSAPGVGSDGSGLGLQNITAPGGDGGVLAGYAVDVDMFQDTGDPSDLGPTTLKLVTMPGFVPVAETVVPFALNDGNLYAVDVSWLAPSSLTATLHVPDGGLVRVSSSDPRLTAPSAYLGFTAATGGISNSHNEVGGVTVTETCH
jgi:hypothetical protein